MQLFTCYRKDRAKRCVFLKIPVSAGNHSDHLVKMFCSNEVVVSVSPHTLDQLSHDLARKIILVSFFPNMFLYVHI